MKEIPSLPTTALVAPEHVYRLLFKPQDQLNRRERNILKLWRRHARNVTLNAAQGAVIDADGAQVNVSISGFPF